MIRANMEQLTPEVVRSATFSTTRLGRRGVDDAEVRAFCLWVSDGLGRLLNDNDMLQAEVMRLRSRLLEGKGKSGLQPEDAHVQAVNLLSRAQETADRYVADAQEYSRDLAEDARMRRDEIVREAKVRASMILEQAHASATEAASAASPAAPDKRDLSSDSERQELQTELAYLRTFSDVCRTHLRAYLESLGRSIEEWEQAERRAAVAARESAADTEKRSNADFTAARPSAG
jgi:cell division septum initiation protein DivIVA